MEKVTIIVPKKEYSRTLRLLQSFQKLELIDSSEGANDVKMPESKQSELNETLNAIAKCRSILSVYEKSGMISNLRNGRTEMTMTELEKRIKSGRWLQILKETLVSDERLAEVRKERSALTSEVYELSPWRSLKYLPALKDDKLAHIDTMLGSLDTAMLDDFKKELLEATDNICYTDTVFKLDDISGVALFFRRTDRDKTDALCKKYNFLPFDYNDNILPSEKLKQLGKKQGILLDEEQRLLEKLEKLAEEKDKIDIAEDHFRNLLLRRNAEKNSLQSKTAVLICGWIEKNNSDQLKKLLKHNFRFPYHLSFEPVKESEIANVPTALTNKKVVRAFESLTEMYSMPAYDEIDPTPIMTPFYLVFFGMMVADIGYGILMMLGTLAAKLLFKLDRGMKNSIDFFFYLSFPTTLWGVIYGSLFGVNLPFALFSPSKDIIPILILSVIFGWMQLMTGLALNTYLSIKKKNVLEALAGGVSWMTLLLGLALLVSAKFVLNNSILFCISIALCVLAVLLIVITPIFQNGKHRVKGFMKGLYALYGATSYIGDLVSYTRLMALGVSGGSIAAAFNTIILTLPLPARLTVGLLLALVLHGLNMFLSFLGAYVHGIRLQYVEFFGKFFSGGGRKFAPFKAAEKNIYISEETIPQTNNSEE